VTHFLRDTLLTGDRASPSNDMMTSAKLTSSLPSAASLAVKSLGEAGFELVTAVSNSVSVLLADMQLAVSR